MKKTKAHKKDNQNYPREPMPERGIYIYIFKVIKLTITGNPIEMALKLLTNHRMARHNTWIPVNIWTFFNGTCRRYLKSG